MSTTTSKSSSKRKRPEFAKEIEWKEKKNRCGTPQFVQIDAPPSLSSSMPSQSIISPPQPHPLMDTTASETSFDTMDHSQPSKKRPTSGKACLVFS
jgi:hypothetical protein